MDFAAKDRIESVVRKNPVVLFMKGERDRPACGFSAKAVQILDALLPSYETVDVLADPELREGIKKYSNWPTIPQLYVRGEFVGGSDIMTTLAESGELEEKLGELTRAPLPRITVSPRAAEELRAALEEPGEMVRFDVSPRFEHDLAVGRPDPRDLVVEVSGLQIAVAKRAAARADGVHIDVLETPEGLAFKIDNPNQPEQVRRMSARELEQRLKSGSELLLIDVRTPEEREIAKLPEARPFDAKLRDELGTLPKERPIVVHCHHGVRSQRVAEQLVEQGFREVYNLTGGIDAWSLDVDPDLPRY